MGNRRGSTRWWRIAPTHGDHLALGVGVADDRRGIVREDARHRRQAADVAVDDAEQRDDRGLVGCDAVEVAHYRPSILQIRAKAAISSINIMVRRPMRLKRVKRDPSSAET